jgi:hypothetical protein
MEPVLLLCGDSSVLFCCDRRITRVSITISFVVYAKNLVAGI